LIPLLTLSCEAGRRWNFEALDLVDKLAAYESKEVPPLLRCSVQMAWKDCWCAIIGIAVQDALAASFLAPGDHGLVLDQSSAF